MFIVNRYNVTTPAPVVATNDAKAVTGNQSPTWGGVNPSGKSGATGNAVAGNELTNVTAVNTFVDQVIAKLVAVSLSAALTAGVDNYVRVPLSQFGIGGVRPVLGAIIVGVYDPNSNEVAPTPTPSLMTVPSQAYVSIVKDSLVLRILAANLALFQGKVANIMLIYS